MSKDRSPFPRAMLAAGLLAAMAAGGLAHAHPADYSALFEETRKSVVGVNALTLEDRRRGSRTNPFPFPFPFPFPDQIPRGQPGQPDDSPDSPFRRLGFGSGVIIDASGHILTNAHVILARDNRTVVDDIEIVLHDKKTYNAEVIGFDIYTDIALLKIDPEGADLQVAKIGDSDALKVGQTVLALGHPLGLDYTLTSGIVSSINRSLLGGATDRHVPFIQTDAVINPGNSGGPLLDPQGNVVGINARIISGRSGGFIGYSLAIPVNLAMEVQAVLRTDGKIERGMLGVTFDVNGVSDDEAAVWGLDPDRGGVLINSIIEDSGADAADLMPGDIILMYDGKDLLDPANFPRYIANTRPGTTVTLLIFRDGAELEVPVTIGSIDTGGVLDGSEGGGDGVPKRPYGMLLSEVPEALRQGEASQRGVLLEGFDDEGGKVTIPQELYKLQSRDIIIGVIVDGDFRQVSSPEQLRRILSELESSVIGFQVLRGRGRPFFVTVNLAN